MVSHYIMLCHAILSSSCYVIIYRGVIVADSITIWENMFPDFPKPVLRFPGGHLVAVMKAPYDGPRFGSGPSVRTNQKQGRQQQRLHQQQERPQALTRGEGLFSLRQDHHRLDPGHSVQAARTLVEQCQIDE